MVNFYDGNKCLNDFKYSQCSCRNSLRINLLILGSFKNSLGKFAMI